VAHENADRLRALLERWDQRILGSGDRLVSIHTVRGRARHTGIEAEGPVAHVWTFRNGKVIHFESYRDPKDALEAVGLRE
jgi:ketosteroid isomerase-like protein